MVKRGQRGDAVLLRPTVMFCVPLILDRIYKGVTEQARRKSALARDLLAFSVQYRLDCINTGQVSSEQSTAVILSDHPAGRLSSFHFHFGQVWFIDFLSPHRA